MAMQKMTMTVLAMSLLSMVEGHGMMLEPPQRSSMWRAFPGDPRFSINYDDNALFCGGYSRQWRSNTGKCGICGDAYDAPYPHSNEVGGKYASGVIARDYSQGDVIDVMVHITANHRGYFTFKLCPNNNVAREVTQECLDDHVLMVVQPDGQLADRYYIGASTGDIHLRLKLPDSITCTQCVLQWTYNTGNSWGCGSGSDGCCVGCGAQENFVNCADIAIRATGNQTPAANNPPTTSTTITTTTATTTIVPITRQQSIRNQPQPATTKPTTTTTTTTTTTSARRPNVPTPAQTRGRCVSTGPYRVVPGMDRWCVLNCSRGFCPSTHCVCPSS